MAHPVPPYGVAIQDAIASGDVGQMQSVAADAERYLQEFGEIGDGLKRLKDEIGRIGGGGGGGWGGHIQPLYGVVIQEAIASGDPDRMKGVAAQAESLLKQADEVRAAYSGLQDAMNKDG